MGKGFLQNVLELELKYKLQNVLQSSPWGPFLFIRVKLFESRYCEALSFSLGEPPGLEHQKNGRSEPIVLGRETVGVLFSVCLRSETSASETPEEVVGLISQILTRHHTRRLYLHEFGVERYWIGNSPAILQFERQLWSLAKESVDVFLMGEDGTGKSIAAFTIHCLSSPAGGQFFTLRADTEKSGVIKICRTLSEADTLYIPLHSLEHLSMLDASDIASECRSSCRLVFSHRSRFGVTGCRNLELPSLESRKEDIWPLLQQILLKNESHAVLHASAISRLAQMSYQRNVHSLESLARKIATLDESEITGETLALVEQHSPCSHPVVTRAIDYIQKNYQKSISLNEVADHVFVSKSHLSFLFKEHTGSSFKQTLTRIRIDSAKTILRTSPHKHVTEVSYEVGYTDLRNFERNFKRELGVTPSQFRASVTRSLKTK